MCSLSRVSWMVSPVRLRALRRGGERDAQAVVFELEICLESSLVQLAEALAWSSGSLVRYRLVYWQTKPAVPM